MVVLYASLSNSVKAGLSTPAKRGAMLDGHELFYFTSCPYCIKVRLALWWSGIELPLRETLFNGNNRSELVTGGGKKQVPCLRIEDDQGAVRWLYESSDIIRYLKQRPAFD